MPKQILHKVFLLLGLSLAGLIAFYPSKAAAANPTTINFQGKVVNSDGTNVTDGTYSFSFRIYSGINPATYDPNSLSCSADSNCKWEETQSSVTVTSGVFQVELGASCPFFTSNACNNSSPLDFNTLNSLYLTMKFSTDAAGYMTPLIHFQSVPYAFNSDRLGGIAASGFIQNTTNSQTSSNFHISGTGQADTALQAPGFDSQTSAAALGIGTANAGVITIGNTTNSTVLFNPKSSATAFVVQNTSSKALLSVDTSGSQVLLGTTGATGVNGQIVFNSATASNYAVTLAVSGSQTASYTLKLPTATPGTSQCLQTTSGDATQLTFSSCGTGGGGTFATTYDSATAANNTVTLAQNGGGIVIKDAVTPITGSSLFTVQNNGGTTKYLDISSASLALGATGSYQTTITGGTGAGGITLSAAGSSTTGIIAKTTTNSSAAFQVQNSSNVSLFTVNTAVGMISTASLLPISSSTIAIDYPKSSVDTTGDIGKYTSIALGSDGFARISYYDFTNLVLKFAQCTNAACTTSNIMTVDNGGGTNNVGSDTSMAIGSDGFARISYYDITAGDLKFAQCTNAACTTRNITSVDTTNDVGQYSSIALGSDGFARISYLDSLAGDLKFAQCTNAACTTRNITSVDTTGFTGHYTSLAIASDGFARISYQNNSGFLNYVQCTNAACTTKTITSVDTASNFSDTSLAIASDGFARISYYDTTNNDLKFAQCTNAACTTSNITSVVATIGINGSDTSMAIGSDGFARISYRDGAAGNLDLKFAQCTNAACTTSNISSIDTAGDVGSYTSLVLGSDGFARISYYDATNGDLKFVSLGETQGAVSGTGIGSSSSMFANVYASNIQANYFKLQSATNVTQAFQIQNAGGTTLFNIDTTNTVITFGSATNGLVLTAGTYEPILNGSARHSKTITLVPEYPGAVMTGDGSSNTGTMTSDFCSGSLHLNIPSAGNPCGSTEEHNYYTWVTTSQNDYDIWVRWQVPSDFSDFAASSPISMYGWRTDSTATTTVTLSLYNSSGNLCGSSTNVATGTAAWTNTALGGTITSSGCSISAGDRVSFRIQMAANNKTVRAGEITIGYLSKF